MTKIVKLSAALQLEVTLPTDGLENAMLSVHQFVLFTVSTFGFSHVIYRRTERKNAIIRRL